MKKILLFCIGLMFLAGCGREQPLPFKLKELEIHSGDVLIEDLGEQEWKYGDFEGAITYNTNSYQAYQVSIPKYHFSHTFSYPTPKEVKKYKYPPLEDWQWIQSGAIVIPPPYVHRNIGTYPQRKEALPKGEAPGDALLWIYEVPDASQDSSPLQIGRTVVAIMKEFFQTESLLTSSLESIYTDNIPEKLEGCKSGTADKKDCKWRDNILEERAFLLGDGELPHLGIQENVPTFAKFGNEDIYGYWFQGCLGTNQELCDKMHKPWFSVVIWNKKHPQEIWHYSQDFTPSRASSLILQ